ncbi:MAG TPA: PA-phosphatase, partial [Micromonosporaceae bacterium]
MRETRTVRRVRLRPVRPAGAWFDGLLLLATVALTFALAGGLLLDVDLAVREWVNAHRPPAAHWIAQGLNYLGQGGWVLLPVALGLAAAVARRTRSVRPFLAVAGTLVLTYGVVGVLKLWTDRAAPSSPLPPEQSVLLFNDTLPPAEY